jgi:hypothetical protein
MIVAAVTPIASISRATADFQAASPWIGIGAAILSRRSIRWRLAGPLSQDKSSSYSSPS